jgi:hypothetical protein
VERHGRAWNRRGLSDTCHRQRAHRRRLCREGRHGRRIDLSVSTATAATGNAAATGPVSRPPQLLGPTASTVAVARLRTGQGAWEFPDDPNALEVALPGDAGKGEYRSTLTFTTAPPAE